jgi:DGQHR domain-containing protein
MPVKDLKLKAQEDNTPGGIRVDIMDRKSNPEGYQREPSSTRANAFGRYVGRAKGISPTAILLSLRTAVTLDGKKTSEPYFETQDKDSGFGILSIPDDVSLWLVDGQHRVQGLNSLVEDEKYADYENFPVAAVVMPTDIEGEEK